MKEKPIKETHSNEHHPVHHEHINQLLEAIKHNKHSKPLDPIGITRKVIEVGITKANDKFARLLILGILAGAFIGFSAEGSNMAAFNLLANPDTFGLGKVLAGAIFGTGLMMVIVGGGELFLGNTLMLAAYAEKKIPLKKMLRNWSIVYTGNLIGGLLIAFMMVNSGLLHSGGDLLGAVTLKTAVYKVNLSFMQGLYLGIMCNWLVCLAVCMAYASDTIVGKMMAVFFPIWLFITSGFENSIANMYYIPAGILIKSNDAFVKLSGLSQGELDSLNWVTFFSKNLLPVTLGNIIGGGILVGMAYWFVHTRGEKDLLWKNQIK